MYTTSVSLLVQLRRSPASTRESEGRAWSRFVQLYTPLLDYWAHRLPGVQESDIGDLLQDLFVLLLQKLPDFEYRPGGGFRGWLLTLLRHHWSDRRRNQPVVLSLSQPGVEEPAMVDPLEELSEKEYREYLVGRAFELMRSDFEPTTWQACWDCIVLEQSPAEVAARLGLSVAAIYVGKSRLLRRLREELEGLLD